MGILDLPNLRREVSLKSYNTYRVGGTAKFFLEAHDAPALWQATAAARESGVPFYVIGGGTNILVSDKGFPGLIIRMMIQKFDVVGDRLIAEAGMSMGALVNKVKALGLSGLEWAAGLPGTLGGAIYGNAGSCGGETGDVIETVESIDPKSGEVKRCIKPDCEFGYRHSIFKSNKEIILRAVLRLKQDDPERVMKRMVENIKFRQARQPLGGRSEGCVFKNIELRRTPAAAYLVSHDLDFAQFKNSEFLLAGFVIDRAGLKGLRVGGAKVSETHANFIVNEDNAAEEDISWIIKVIKNKVLDRYKISLEEEIRFIGIS